MLQAINEQWAYKKMKSLYLTKLVIFVIKIA